MNNFKVFFIISTLAATLITANYLCLKFFKTIYKLKTGRHSGNNRWSWAEFLTLLCVNWLIIYFIINFFEK